MLYIGLALLVLSIGCCCFINERRKAPAVLMTVFVFALCTLMGILNEIYVAPISAFGQRMYSVLFILFFISLTVQSRNNPALLKFETVVSVCMVFFNIFGALSRLNAVSVDFLLPGMVVFSSPFFGLSRTALIIAPVVVSILWMLGTLTLLIYYNILSRAAQGE